MIGLHAVPVAFGTDGGDVAGKQRAPEPTSFSYMPPDGSERSFSLETGRTLLFRTLVGAAPKSVIVCIISSLKDVALFLRDNEALFAAKVKEVSIMGGVVSRDDDKDDEALLVPDTAHNNMFDKPAADFFYRRCQELGVRLIVVGRDCAYQVKTPRPKGSGRRLSRTSLPGADHAERLARPSRRCSSSTWTAPSNASGPRPWTGSSAATWSSRASRPS